MYAQHHAADPQSAPLSFCSLLFPGSPLCPGCRVSAHTGPGLVLAEGGGPAGSVRETQLAERRLNPCPHGRLFASLIWLHTGLCTGDEHGCPIPHADGSSA